MRHRSTLAAVAVSVVAVAATTPGHAGGSPASSVVAGATAAVIEGHLDYTCFGCGPTTAAFEGAVVAGSGLLPTGAVVSIAVSADVPAAACPVLETASGTILVDGEPYAGIAWSRFGAFAVATLSNGGAATVAVAAPGSPCGSANGSATATITLQAPGDDPEGGEVVPTGACLAAAPPDDSIRTNGTCVGGLAGVAVNPVTGEITAGDAVLRGAFKTSHKLYTIGIGYTGTRLNGNQQLLFVTTNQNGCRYNASFRFNTMAGGWDNRIRSGRMGNSCRAFFYENQNLTGSSRQCVDVCRHITEGVSSAFFLR